LKNGAAARRFLEAVPHALVLLVFRLIFTGKTNRHYILLGAVVSLPVSLFSYHLLSGRLDPHLNLAFDAFAAHLERFVNNVPQPMLLPEVCGSIHRNHRRRSRERGWRFLRL
jgi:hypothetical protein